MKQLYQTLLITGTILALSTPAAFAKGNHATNYKVKPYHPPSSYVAKDAYISHNGWNSNMRPDGKSSVTTPYSPGRHLMLTDREVRQVQNALRANGYKVKVDGVWGKNTTAAIRDFQRQRSLRVNGELDNATFAALDINSVYVTREGNGYTYRRVAQ